MDELVSVIIPTYNREKVILNSVNSVLQQTYQNIELIIVDDASTDNTISLIDNIGDDRIHIIINKENRGANYSRNRGVEEAMGTYIAFQDSDDIWMPEKLEKCIRALEENEADVVFSGMMKYGKNYKRYLPLYNLNEYEDKYHKLLSQNCISTQTIVGKKECFESCLFDEKLPKMQDWDEMLRIIQQYNVFYVEAPLVKAYIQKDSITLNKKTYDALNMIYSKHEEYIEHHSDIKMAFCIMIGKALEENGESGTTYFKKAFLINKSIRNGFVYFCAKFRIYFIILGIKKIGRAVIAKIT